MEEKKEWRGKSMGKDDLSKVTPDPSRLEMVKNLPKEVLQSLTKEEVKVLLSEDEWPESLHEKLKDYVVKSPAVG